MTNTIDTSTSISFTEDEGFDAPRVILREHTEIYAGWQQVTTAPTFGTVIPSIKVRVYPSGISGMVLPGGDTAALKVEVSLGSITDEGTRTESIEGEPIQFTGSDRADTEYLPSGSVTIHNNNKTYDETGAAVTISFTTDSKGRIKASKSFHGGITVDYDTKYRLFKYTYGQKFMDGKLLYVPGSIFAFYQGAVATSEFSPRGPEVPTEDNPKREIYKDVTYTIVNDKGLFERPDGWTGEDDSPTFAGGDPDPAGSFTETTRVHATGYVDKYGRIKVETFDHEPGYHEGFEEVQEERVIATVDPNATAQDIRDNARGLSIAPAPKVFQVGGTDLPT